MLLSSRKQEDKKTRIAAGGVWRARIFAASGCLFLVLFLLFLESGAALAADWKLNGTFAVKEEYNDNIFFDETSVKDDFITTISPGLELTRNTERLQLGLMGRLDRRLYNSSTDLNATDQLYQGSVRYSLSPKASISGRAEYGKDSSPDRDLETTGLVLSNVERKRQRYTFAGNYDISEKTAASLSYEYYQEDYDSPEESDLESNGVSLLLVRDLSAWVQATKGRVNIGYTRYAFTDSTIDSYGASLGVSKAFSEVWSILLDVGGRYTQSTFEVEELQFVPPIYYRVVKEERETDGWGFVGKAVLSHRGEKSTIDFTLNHDLMPASGRSGTTNRTTLSFRASQKFTYELSGSVSGGYYLNKSDQQQYSTEEIDEETLYVNTGVRYEFTKDYALDASYTYTKTSYNVTDTDADRNLFMVRFYVLYPFLD
jgi:hypothetical protein